MAPPIQGKAKAPREKPSTDKSRTRLEAWPCIQPKLIFTPSPHAKEAKDGKPQTDKRVTGKRPDLAATTAFCRPVDATKTAAAIVAFQKNARFGISLIPACRDWFVAPPMPPLTMDTLDSYMDKAGIWDPANDLMFAGENQDEFQGPPIFSRLPDTYLFEVTRRASTHARCACWPKDFGLNGEIRTGRLPAGGAVICKMFGIPFVAVWDTCYMLAGEAQMWGPIPCGHPASKTAVAEFHFGAVVASPAMVEDDRVLMVDIQSDTSPLTDFNHLVLLLQDDGAPAQLAYVWQLAGFQSRMSAEHEPMSEQTWSMSGDNPNPYNTHWVDMSVRDALKFKDLNRFENLSPTVSATNLSLNEANEMIRRYWDSTLDTRQEGDSLVQTNLNGFNLPGWKFIGSATESQSDQDDHKSAALQPKRRRLTEASAPPTLINLWAALNENFTAMQNASDVMSMAFFKDEILQVMLEDNDFASLAQDIVSEGCRADTTNDKALQVIKDIATLAATQPQPSSPASLRQRINKLPPRKKTRMNLIVQEFYPSLLTH
ncbi:hypothetical protein N7452_004840 [Penicillium brevicompactum]|uniref:Uncharacterized protein n=1 Tax=Penicillium brevicompactum TaxID=5074 RepID=A0A9W9QHJ6_PENBR|nr:hypothetical protein N7452_004840 [Penicillium brevicompactum]